MHSIQKSAFIVAAVMLGAIGAQAAVDCREGSFLIPNSTGHIVCVKKGHWDKTKGWAGCTASEIPIPDGDLSERKFICISTIEWEKAKRNCAKFNSVAMECICQDGDSVGACGD